MKRSNPKRLNPGWVFVLVLLFCICLTDYVSPAELTGETAVDKEVKLLWQIGQADNDTAELALGPGSGYSNFKQDGFFIVGLSEPNKDWPYLHPGPANSWADARPHSFDIYFGLKAKPEQGNCRLLFDLVDTHPVIPPTLLIKVNNEYQFTRTLPVGAGEGSLSGKPSKGREYLFDISFPISVLKTGNNVITITTISDSWFLYDSLSLETPAAAELGPVSGAAVDSIENVPFVVETDGKLYQLLYLKLRLLDEDSEVRIRIDQTEVQTVRLGAGIHTLEVPAPAVDAETPITVTIEVAEKTIAKQQVLLKPVRRWEVYLLPHSHVDIGYTRVQDEVERQHWGYYEDAIELSGKTADYPEGAQFKWNVEVLWAVDGYLKQASPEKRKAFIEAVKKGWIGLDALYSDELTALCRPEELIQLVDYARRLKKEYGLTIDSAMISDVPGYTWGIVPVLAQSGVKYFSIGPNFIPGFPHGGGRVGFTMEAWGDKPFYWLSPCGKYKILFWMCGEGYSSFHGNKPLSVQKLLGLFKRLNKLGYPYDMVQLRYTIGDNGPPDPRASEFLKNWNAKYVWPKLVITTTSKLFHEFERRYGNQLPTVRGDFTPYWEDGAASSARETGIARNAAERLVQAETLWAILNPKNYPYEEFQKAWRNVVLYNEHTWGAWNSISEPDSDFVKAQWDNKQAFALDADIQSRKLLNDALAEHRSTAEKVTAVDVFNTSSWVRTDLVVLPKDLALAGDLVKCPKGEIMPSQRLSTGELAFLAKSTPAIGAKRFTFHAGKAGSSGAARAQSAALSNDSIALTVDEKTGAIATLLWKDLGIDVVDYKNGAGLNDYFYVSPAKVPYLVSKSFMDAIYYMEFFAPDQEPKKAQRNGPVKITVKEKGPLVSSLLIESDAPGCYKLSRELRIIDGLDRVDITNIVDKQAIRKKEGVHFGFAFNVPDGVMKMDMAWAVVQPNVDQISGANKNYFAVQRWVDISNKDFGVTWATLDAPLVEVGAITAETPWIKHLEPSQKLYSYVMNNYWFTNYRADQEGPTKFRYSIEPHQQFDAARAAKFGAECSQPLIAVPVHKDRPIRKSLLDLSSAGVVVTALKPSKDGKALIVRLFNTTEQSEKVELTWAEPAPQTVRMSSLAEEELHEISGPIDIAAYEFITLRASLPGQ